MPEQASNKLVVWLNLDGWGLSLNIENNAIRKAQIDGFKNLVATYPSTALAMPNLKVSRNYQLLGSGLEIDSPLENSKQSLSRTISEAAWKQLKIAASHDFPLASVFFNNSGEIFDREVWQIVDKTENRFLSLLGSDQLLKNLIKQIEVGDFNFILAIMSDIGRQVLSGDFLSVISAVEKASEALEKISQAVLDRDGVLIVSSAYGGAEDVFNIGTGLANKKRTGNAVPFLIIGHDYQGRTIGLQEAPNNDLSLLSPQGKYMDIFPTVLKILNLDPPPGLPGQSLV